VTVSASGQAALGRRAAAKPTARRGAWRRHLAGYLFIAPWLFGFLAFTLIPITASAALAFTNYNGLSSSLGWVGLDNLATMAQDQRFWRSVRATFLFAFAAVPLKLVFALALAMLLNNARRTRLAARGSPRGWTRSRS
jgi:multiple sugar transport system permease protein